jgi:large subunit ribosomal protein L18e
MRVRDKNEPLADLIRKLQEKGRHENVPLWTAIAEKLNRPRRKAYEVNLYNLERDAPAKGMVVVPGYVLGAGSIKKPLTVAALKFSGKAAEKIEKAGGKALHIDKLLEEKVAAKGITIMG